MDIVFIKGLKVPATIGIYDWEKTIKQTLVFDVEMASDVAAAAKNDDIEQTLNYAEISEDIALYVDQNPIGLIESLAENLAAHLRNQYNIKGIKLTVNKPTAVENADTVGVTIVRGQFQ